MSKLIEDRIAELVSDPARPDCKGYPCEFGHSGGMRTQGGCRCLRDLPPATARAVSRQMRLLREAEHELRRLREQLRLANIDAVNATTRTDQWREMAQLLDDLLVCYRLQKRPSDRLLDSIKDARKALRSTDE